MIQLYLSLAIRMCLIPLDLFVGREYKEIHAMIIKNEDQRLIYENDHQVTSFVMEINSTEDGK